MTAKKEYKVRILKERCKGCELCVTVCVKEVLEISEERETNEKGYRFARVVKQKDCTGCANCAMICPDTLIEIYENE